MIPPNDKDSKRNARIAQILERALELTPEKREAYLGQECGSDASLLAEVRDLLHRETRPTEAATTPGPSAGDAAAFELGVPERIGPYRILETIGAGGMGVVYLAEQEQPFRRRVAIKIIKLGMDTAEVIGRFESERQALAMLSHTNIAKVFDAGATGQGRPYFVMEHVPGIALTDYCDRHHLSTRERLELFIPICHAIQHAHQKGIIHRDLKPTNILVTLESGKAVPKIIDFGVAKATNQQLTARTFFTEHGRLIGTPAYMSPEQAEMTGLDVDATTDIYSLGVVLYELLVGALPHDPQVLRQAGLEAIHRIIREVDPPTPSSRVSTLGDKAQIVALNRKSEPPALAKQVRGELDWITMRAIEKDRTRRYPSASELAADIERYLRGEAVLAGPPSATYQLKKVLRRHKGLVASLLAVLLVLALGLAVSTSLYFRAEHARSREAQQTRKAERISQFLHDMLASARPAEKGRDVTVRQVIDQAARKADLDLLDQPEVQASVRSTIGSTYMALGLYSLAEEQLQGALATRQSVFGPEHPEVASSLDDLSALKREMGENELAIRLSRSALDMNRRLLGERNPIVATNLSNLATLLKDQARPAEAESLCRAALAIRSELFGEGSAEVASSLNNLAGILQDEGSYAAAESVMARALMTWKGIHGAAHPDVAAGLGNLAGIYLVEGKYAPAESLLREALPMAEALYGTEHPSVPETMHNLATALDYQGKSAEAEALYRKALLLYKPILGDQHPSIASCLNGLAVLLQARGEQTEAEALHRQALAMRRALYGDKHPSVASSLSNLALLEQESGRYADAESDYREALAIQEAALGGDHPRVASTLLGLGSVLVERGDVRGAEPLLRRCLEIRRKAYAEGAWQVADAQNTLGHCLASAGRYAEAESLVVRSLPVIKAASAMSLTRKQRALERAIALYRGWGKAKEAAVYQAELRGLSEKPASL